MIWVVIIGAIAQLILWLITKKQNGQKLTDREKQQLGIALGKMQHAITLSHTMGIEPILDEEDA